MALGMIEVYGFTTAIVVADCVAKTANSPLVLRGKKNSFLLKAVQISVSGELLSVRIAGEQCFGLVTVDVT